MHKIGTSSLIAIAWIVIGYFLGVWVWFGFGWIGWIGAFSVMMAHLWIRHKDVNNTIK